jgi:hypothetical protein
MAKLSVCSPSLMSRWVITWPIEVARRFDADAVLYRLMELFVSRRPPDYIRPDNGTEFTARAVRGWLSRVGVKTLYIEPGSPWKNGYNESFRVFGEITQTWTKVVLYLIQIPEYPVGKIVLPQFPPNITGRV